MASMRSSGELNDDATLQIQVIRRHRDPLLGGATGIGTTERQERPRAWFRYSQRLAAFRYLRAHLTGSGFAVYGFDLRGFGRSGGRRAYVHRWQDFGDDIRLFVKAVERDGATGPL